MQISFTKAGKNIAHEMRHRVAMCGNLGELEETFSEVSGKFISAVTGSVAGGIPRGIMFDTAARNHFRISAELDDEPVFRQVWYRSDLPEMIGKFADAAWHRYLHIQKNNVRTNIKIRI